MFMLPFVTLRRRSRVSQDFFHQLIHLAAVRPFDEKNIPRT